MLASKPVLRDIVLIGGGHSHVVVLRMFAMRPLPGVRLTLICTDTDTPYSGMLPGYIAGHYGFDEVHIDLRQLAEFAGARYLRDEVIGIDRAERKVLCREHPPVSYDALSINIGSTPQLGRARGRRARGAGEADPPLQRALAGAVRARARPRRATTIAVVGAGAAGVELTLAMQYRLRNELKALGRDPDELHFHLFSAEPSSCRHTMPPCAAPSKPCLPRAASACMQCRSQPGRRRAPARRGRRQFRCRRDRLGHPGRRCRLAQDTGPGAGRSGFIRIGETLQSETDPLIFAAGDCAAMTGYRWKRPASSPCAWARRWRRTCAAASPMRGTHPLPSAIALAGADQHRRPPRGGLARLALRARRLDLALEGLDRPPLHAQVLRA
jgi:selenide,water dikinase